MDAFALRSHQRAARATDEGRFANEIVALEARVHPGVPGANDVNAAHGLLESDEGVRRDTSSEKLAALKPAFSETGTVTAGTSSQISDGAAAVLIMSEERASSLGCVPRARFHTFAVAANDPQIMLTAPIPATQLVLSKAKLTLDDIDLVEINEAFASVVLSWEREYRPDMQKVNPNGGAIAIGHPTGCSGARLMVTLLNELERARWPLRAADHVRGGRAGERDDHRAVGLMSGSGSAAPRRGFPRSRAGSPLATNGDGARAARLALHEMRHLRLPGRGELLPEPGLRLHVVRDGRAVAAAAASGPTPTPATSRRRPTWRPTLTSPSASPRSSWRPRSWW